MALSKLPRDAVPLDAREEAAWIESLQGDWDIEAGPRGHRTSEQQVRQANRVQDGQGDGKNVRHGRRAGREIIQADVFLYKIPVHGASLPRRMGLDAYDAGLAENAPDARTGR